MVQDESSNFKKVSSLYYGSLFSGKICAVKTETKTRAHRMETIFIVDDEEDMLQSLQFYF